MFANVPLAYVLWAFFGLFGAHRFYVGRWESGLVYLFTFGGCFVGWIIDFFILPQLVEDVSRRAGVGWWGVCSWGPPHLGWLWGGALEYLTLEDFPLFFYCPTLPLHFLPFTFSVATLLCPHAAQQKSVPSADA